MIEVDNKKAILLDSIGKDIVMKKVDLYKELDGDKYLPLIISQNYPLEKFIHLAIDYLKEFHPKKPYKEIFIGLVDMILDKDEFISFHKQRESIYEFFNSLEDIEYGVIPKDHFDFEVVYEMMKEHIDEKEGVE